jgi:hypothetical protein
MDELKAERSSGARPTKRAPMLPIILIVAMELGVVDDDRPLFERAFACYRLVRVWAVMRFGDTEAVYPSKLVLGSAGLSGYVEQSLVTEPGKKVGRYPSRSA